MSVATKILSFAEVSDHNNSKDCWLVIGGKVFDVTRFLEEHPGGDDVLLSSTGKDATDDFEDVGHSADARALMQEFCIGDIDLSTLPSKPTYTPASQAKYDPDKTTEFVLKILQFLVPVAILCLAVAVRVFTKKSE
eukprot:c17533_g1_i1 orf=173-580(+)